MRLACHGCTLKSLKWMGIFCNAMCIYIYIYDTIQKKQRQHVTGSRWSVLQKKKRTVGCFGALEKKQTHRLSPPPSSRAPMLAGDRGMEVGPLGGAWRIPLVAGRVVGAGTWREAAEAEREKPVAPIQLECAGVGRAEDMFDHIVAVESRL